MGMLVVGVLGRVSAVMVRQMTCSTDGGCWCDLAYDGAGLGGQALNQGLYIKKGIVFNALFLLSPCCMIAAWQ